MTIQFECGNCGKELSTSEEKAGKTGKCPDCGEPVTVPQPQSPFDFESPAATFAQSLSQASIQTCPMCGAESPETVSSCPQCGEELNRAERDRRSVERVSTGHKIDAGQVLSTAWNRFSLQPGAAIAGCVIAMLAMVGFVLLAIGGLVLSDKLASISFGLEVLGSIVVSLGFSAAFLWLMLGLTSFSISLARERAADFGLLFSGGKFILRAVLCSFLIGIFLLLACLVLLAVTFVSEQIAVPIVEIVALLTAFIVTIRVMMSFLWTIHILVDTDASDVTAVFQSRDLMSGNYFAVFLILLVNGLILMIPGVVLLAVFLSSGLINTLAIFLAIMISLFLVAPLTCVIMAVTYDHLSGGAHRRPGDDF